MIAMCIMHRVAYSMQIVPNHLFEVSFQLGCRLKRHCIYWQAAKKLTRFWKRACVSVYVTDLSVVTGGD